MLGVLVVAGVRTQHPVILNTPGTAPRVQPPVVVLTGGRVQQGAWGPRGAILLPGDTTFITPLLGRRGSPGRRCVMRGRTPAAAAARQCVTPHKKAKERDRVASSCPVILVHFPVA